MPHLYGSRKLPTLKSHYYMLSPDIYLPDSLVSDRIYHGMNRYLEKKYLDAQLCTSINQKSRFLIVRCFQPDDHCRIVEGARQSSIFVVYTLNSP